MSIKNNPNISLFSQRLFALMDEYNKTCSEGSKIDTPKKLAAALYDAGYIKVRSRENFNDPQRDRNNAIQSIEKKIRKHINTGKISDDSGEYLPAYVKFFGCSSDYLLGFTDVSSKDIEVRLICKKTGLSEISVANLIENAPQEDDDEDVFCCSRWWSDLLSSELFTTAPNEWFLYISALLKLNKTEAKIKAINKAINEVSSQDGIAAGLAEARETLFLDIHPALVGIVNSHMTQLLDMYTEIFESKAKVYLSKHGEKDFEEYFENEIRRWKIWEKIIDK